jgi:hypothetical protein
MKKKCAMCPKEFESRNSLELTCSPECSKANEREYHRKWRKDQAVREARREYQRKWMKDPAYLEARREYDRERKRTARVNKLFESGNRVLEQLRNEQRKQERQSRRNAERQSRRKRRRPDDDS